MKFSKVVFIAAVLLFACGGATAARTVLQEPEQQQPPPQCQDTWEPERIQCNFQCPTTGNWEFSCEAQSANVASCNLKREEAEEQEAIYFLCLITAPNSPPDCQQGIQALNEIPDPCVTENVNQIVSAWPSAPSQD
ncbi:hypothetical protein Ndes2526B_g09204 [Nannochloris sp. 'desiccata']|nr:hypothetical protein KSW81_003760 [Chlorella desiccata (nom. nud.)]KAH7615890.1 hypothetical protein NADE_000727 [Chlorella desiccata (nom. nud.)]